MMKATGSKPNLPRLLEETKTRVDVLQLLVIDSIGIPSTSPSTLHALIVSLS